MTWVINKQKARDNIPVQVVISLKGNVYILILDANYSWKACLDIAPDNNRAAGSSWVLVCLNTDDGVPGAETLI